MCDVQTPYLLPFTVHRIFLPFIGYLLPFIDYSSFLPFFVRTFVKRVMTSTLSSESKFKLYQNEKSNFLPRRKRINLRTFKRW